MESSLCRTEADLDAMRGLVSRSPSGAGIVDFEEHLLLPSVKSTMRLWRAGEALVGLAYVDDFSNLWFEVARDSDSLEVLESEIVEWGSRCIRDRVHHAGAIPTLDCSTELDDAYRIGVLERHSFARSHVRTLRFARPLDSPLPAHPLPDGFSIRSVKGIEEVPQLVALHRLAFGTTSMTPQHRLAMMSAPGYVPQLDLVAVAPDSERAAFCVCGWADEARGIAFTDPIGTHPRYRRLGLAVALVSVALRALRGAGALTATLGTSSENLAMQRLAVKLGFRCISERLWFSKNVA